MMPVPVSETVLTGDSAEERRHDRNPHEYGDFYCDGRGKNTGARVRRNTSFTEIERQRSMGCERPHTYSRSTETRQGENRRGQGNGERSDQKQADLLLI